MLCGIECPVGKGIVRLKMSQSAVSCLILSTTCDKYIESGE